MPNSWPRTATRWYSSDDSSSALVGMQPTWRQVPPSLSDSTRATLRPSWEARIAAGYPPMPPPRIATSKSAAIPNECWESSTRPRRDSEVTDRGIAVGGQVSEIDDGGHDVFLGPAEEEPPVVRVAWRERQGEGGRAVEVGGRHVHGAVAQLGGLGPLDRLGPGVVEAHQDQAVARGVHAARHQRHVEVLECPRLAARHLADDSRDAGGGGR